MDSASRLIFGLLAALAIAGQWGPFTVLRHSWKTLHPSEATVGLYATPADAALWGRVRELARREKVMVFSKTGGAFVVFPEMDSSRVWFLLRSTATPIEIDRVKEQLREADWLVLPYAGDQALYPRWPEFSEELEAFSPSDTGDSFQLWRRKRR